VQESLLVSDIAALKSVPILTVQERKGGFSARVSWALVASIFSILIVFFWMNEWPTGNWAFSVAITGAVAAFFAVLTGRVLFGTLLATSQVIIVCVAAKVKLQMMDMLVHAYDLFFYFHSLSTVTFLASSYPIYTFGLLGTFLLTAFLGVLVYKADGARVSRWHAAAGLVLLSLVGIVALETTGERRHMHLYYSNRFLSTYYGSWPETIRTIVRGQLMEAADKAPGKHFTGIGNCVTAQKKPHVILIHQESMVQPTLFPGLSYDPSMMPFFKSHDGKVHKLRVETYGGASWLTEFSVLAGVSTYSFGSMRQFVQAFMEGKVKETIPQIMADCGYRNVLFYPMMKNFVSNARFYESIGLKEIFDMKDQKASSTTERDRFYYSNAMDEMQRHFSASTKPLFTFIQTMSGHWPYDYAYFPDVKADGGGPGSETINHPEMNEYLRRVKIASGDYAWLKDELKRRFPKESFVIVNYGDHQPSATRMLLGAGVETEVEDVQVKSQGLGFHTYYSIETQNWRAPAMPDVPILDVPYIGLALLEAAKLPLTDAFQERKRLLQLCQGRYHSCTEEGVIMAFHRRLIDAGIMNSR
jgi:phosphoglycerol transferase MdoB-like AlkP superfamily enzyme